MEPFRWILLLAGIALIFAIFCYSRGWYPKFGNYFTRAPRGRGVNESEASGDSDVSASAADQPPASVAKRTKVPRLLPESKVITVRIMPHEGQAFPAENLILALRSAGLRHGQFGIFHAHAEDDDERIRYSVASLVEPGSFDLTHLKDSEYRGISIFAVLPAPEDGLQLFDDMVAKAREISRAIDGCLADEQGGTFSLQRERYMREDVIEYLRRRDFSDEFHRQNVAE